MYTLQYFITIYSKMHLVPLIQTIIVITFINSNNIVITVITFTHLTL